MKNHSIIIDIVSDIVCPWCWVGKKGLDEAITTTDAKDITIHWRPFMLDAAIPKNGVPYKEYLEKKFGKGRANQFKPMRHALEERGRDLGIGFKFDDIPIRPNTLKAHQVMRWAAQESKAHEVSEALFRAFFSQSLDIGDSETLGKIAASVGMDADLVTKNLIAGKDAKHVEQELAYFQKLGVTSVPTFIYNGTFAISGGQPAQAHHEALQKAASTPLQNILTVLNN